MNILQAWKALEPFTLKVDAPTTIGRVAFRNGFGYEPEAYVRLREVAE